MEFFMDNWCLPTLEVVLLAPDQSTETAAGGKKLWSFADFVQQYIALSSALKAATACAKHFGVKKIIKNKQVSK